MIEIKTGWVPIAGLFDGWAPRPRRPVWRES